MTSQELWNIKPKLFFSMIKNKAKIDHSNNAQLAAMVLTGKLGTNDFSDEKQKASSKINDYDPLDDWK